MRRRFMRIMVWFMIAVLFLLLIPIAENYIFPKRQVSTQNTGHHYVDITRSKYYLRNFMWSGIFPLYGGFIRDPHYLFQLPVDLTQYLSAAFQNKPVRYQLVQVNPYFKNKTSEMILAMEIDGVPYEYQLEVPVDYPAFILESEPPSEFLYHGDNLYFILSDGSELDFLIYEILPPFHENKLLTYNLVTIGKSDVPAFLKFPFSQDQIDRFINHQSNRLYDFYTKYLNTNYVMDQLHSQKGETLTLSTLYGAGLNLKPSLLNELIKQNKGSFGLQLQSNYEFITSVQQVEITHAPLENKMIIEVEHRNYYDVLSVRDTFAASSFSTKQETKFILIRTDDIDRMISHIEKYMNRRREKSKEIEYLKDRVEGTYDNIPFLMEMITKHESAVSIQRLGMSFIILPPNASHQLLGNYSNRTTYATPNMESQSEYLFVMDFQDFSLKLTYDEVLELASFLKRIREVSDQPTVSETEAK